MRNKYQTIKRMEGQLKNIDVQIMATLKKIEQTYQGSDIPLPVKRKMQGLLDSKKDFADKVQEMKSLMNNSWEQLEKEADSIHKEFTRSIKTFTEKIY